MLVEVPLLLIGSCMKHLPCFWAKYSNTGIRDDFVNTSGFICSFVSSCVSCVYSKSPKLCLEALNFSLLQTVKSLISDERHRYTF